MKKNYRVVLVMLCAVLVICALCACGKSFKVTYYDNDKMITQQTVAQNETAKAPSEPSKEGYVFEGWYQDQALTKKFDFSTKITAETKIYAKFVTTSK